MPEPTAIQKREARTEQTGIRNSPESRAASILLPSKIADGLDMHSNKKCREQDGVMLPFSLAPLFFIFGILSAVISAMQVELGVETLLASIFETASCVC